MMRHVVRSFRGRPDSSTGSKNTSTFPALSSFAMESMMIPCLLALIASLQMGPPFRRNLAEDKWTAYPRSRSTSLPPILYVGRHFLLSSVVHCATF